MKGWTELCSDASWEDYHGMWAKKDKRTGAWYILRWTNMFDAMGEEECQTNGVDQFECDVKWLDLRLLPAEEVDAALQCYSLKFDEKRETVLDDRGEPIVSMYTEHVIVECCISYGLGAPLESFTGSVKPRNVRANARRYAEECMRDSEQLREQLSRPVNAIGSTAFEYGVGDLDAAMDRGRRPGVFMMRQSDFLKCPFAIMAPEHYREDGTCRCDDPKHRAKMVAEWGYSEEDIVARLGNKNEAQSVQ